MSMKINIENEDDYNTDLNNIMQNKFNANEENNLFDAPSFMEESYVQITNNKKSLINNDDKNIINENEINNNMIISQNDIEYNDNDNVINNGNINNNFDIFHNSFNNRKEEIINTDINQLEEPKLNIKSTLLNKKRLNKRHLESILEEEEEQKAKNEEDNDMNISISKLKKENISNREKSIALSSKIDINQNRKNKLNDTSMMSLSMKSLDSIKNEINKRREENLRNVEEMHKRHGLNYDLKQEQKIREKILNEYYKDKAKRIAEAKLQMEKEKLKREEKFNKLKIKKIEQLKFNSQKKPKISTESKSIKNQIESNDNDKFLAPKDVNKKPPNTMPKPNLLQNFSFSNNNGLFNTNNETKEKKDEKKIINETNNKKKEDNKSLFGNEAIKINEKPILNGSLFGITKSKNDNNNSTNSLFGSQNNNKDEKQESKKSLFGFQANNKDENQESKKSLFGFQANNKDENQESKKSLFGSQANDKDGKIKKENEEAPKLLFVNPDNNKKQEPLELPKLVEKKENNESNPKIFDNKSISIFSSMIKPEPQKEKKEEIKVNNDMKQDTDFFASSLTNLANQTSFGSLFAESGKNQNAFTTNTNPEKGSLFNQNNQVSNAINNQSLFTSNQNGPNNGSLADKSKNPFLNHHFNPPSTSLFGNNNQVNNQATRPLF